MKKKDFLKMIEEIIEAESGTLIGDELIEDLEAWDSLAIVNFIALVDENFGLTLSPQEIQESKTVNDLMALLGNEIRP